jgi:tetratricopeptide (TPR) repeat protein
MLLVCLLFLVCLPLAAKHQMRQIQSLGPRQAHKPGSTLNTEPKQHSLPQAEKLYKQAEAEILTEKKIRLYLRATQAWPGHAASWFRLGWLYQKQNMRKFAEKFYLKCLKHKPDHWAAHNNLGNVYLDRHNYSLALHHYKKALHYNPEYALAALNLANYYRGKKDFVRARKYYRRTLKLDPGNFWANLNMAGILLRSARRRGASRSQLQEINQMLTRAERIKPGYPVTALQRGYLQELSGDEHEALRYWNTLFRKLPASSKYRDVVRSRMSRLE